MNELEWIIFFNKLFYPKNDFINIMKKNIIIKNINIIIKAYKIKINENEKMDLMIYIINPNTPAPRTTHIYH